MDLRNTNFKILTQNYPVKQKNIQIEHRTSSLAAKMDKIDAFTDSMASNRADISELKGAFSETTRVQTELREIQNNLIGIYSLFHTNSCVL